VKRKALRVFLFYEVFTAIFIKLVFRAVYLIMTRFINANPGLLNLKFT